MAIFNVRGALMRKGMLQGNPVDQIIGSCIAPYQTVTFDHPIYDTDGFWDYTRNGFLIPSDVSFIRLTAQVVFATNGYGLRQLLIQRSDPGASEFLFFEGVPIHNTPAVVTTTTDIALSSAVLPVRAGECYALQPYQDSGYAIAISGGTGTFFGLEVVQ